MLPTPMLFNHEVDQQASDLIGIQNNIRNRPRAEIINAFIAVKNELQILRNAHTQFQNGGDGSPAGPVILDK